MSILKKIKKARQEARAQAKAAKTRAKAEEIVGSVRCV